MDSFLTVISRVKGKQSLSCNDLTAIGSEYDELDAIKQLRKDSKDACWSRFLRPKHAGSMDRTKSRSSNELVNTSVNTLDFQLAQIREKLAMFREQDTEFHERMDSLSNSIGELASMSSLSSFTSSETSDRASASSDLTSFTDDDNEELDYTAEDSAEDDQILKNEMESISKSFSSEVLDFIPTIKVTGCGYNRKRSSRLSSSRSDPAIHESAKLLSTNRHSICSMDHAYLYCAGEISTIL